MDSNQKRIESCKKVGGDEKRKGHSREIEFRERWGSPSETTYKAEADEVITNEDFLNLLRDKLGPLKDGNTSIKGGKSMQFTLGNIPEITNASNKLEAIQSRSIWEKYLGKYHSGRPASILAYCGASWVFFRMVDVIDFIGTCKWRLLSTGRLKGDFTDDSAKSKNRTIFTYEYRTRHGSHFLGASGGQGIHFINILKKSIPFVER